MATRDGMVNFVLMLSRHHGCHFHEANSVENSRTLLKGGTALALSGSEGSTKV